MTPDLRQLYNPLQPTVKQTAEAVTYREILPDFQLQGMIYCYWQLKTTQTLSAPFTYRVVADGCIDIFFELDQPTENFVMGFCKKFTEFPLENSFHYIGVRFLPTMFPQLFQINAAELANQFQYLENVEPETARYITTHFHPQSTLEEIKTHLDDYFKQRVAKADFDFDPRLYGAIEIILRQAGVLEIQADLDTGISQRQLRRLFNFYIGDTPKTFANVVRFQNILRAKPSTQSLHRNKLFTEIGYYDQAHFIKEFKNFYGVTPTQAFGR